MKNAFFEIRKRDGEYGKVEEELSLHSLFAIAGPPDRVVFTLHSTQEFEPVLIAFFLFNNN